MRRGLRAEGLVWLIGAVVCLLAAIVGDDLNQMIYKSRFKLFPTTYDFDLDQFSSHDL